MLNSTVALGLIFCSSELPSAFPLLFRSCLMSCSRRKANKCTLNERKISTNPQKGLSIDMKLKLMKIRMECQSFQLAQLPSAMEATVLAGSSAFLSLFTQSLLDWCHNFHSSSKIQSNPNYTTLSFYRQRCPMCFKQCVQFFLGDWCCALLWMSLQCLLLKIYTFTTSPILKASLN